MKRAVSIAGRASWLEDDDLQRLLSILSGGDEEARVAGGAVRNALLGEPVTDIDIATTNLPDATMKRAGAAGYRAIPTGKEHGTITVIARGRPIEVTTLRSDVETDGRRARVVFGRDWKRDAERRDFTINALYAEADGTVIDLVGGLADLDARTIRFIGDPESRIREDYLRILRFFRFFARYGHGRPDAEALKACARLKGGMSRLSAERVWLEMRKLLAAPDPSRALLWMRQASVLTAILPETEKWGIDAIHGLVAAEREFGWAADPLLRLAAMVPPDEARMRALAGRLRLSKAEGERLAEWARTAPVPATTEMAELERRLYRDGQQPVGDRLRISLAGTPDEAARAGFAALAAAAEAWERPRFPISGSDLLGAGHAPGPTLGALLESLEASWVESGFALDRDALMARAAEAKGN